MVQNQEYVQERLIVLENFTNDCMYVCFFFFSSPEYFIAARCHADPSTGNDTTSQSLPDTIAGQIDTTMETKHSEREPNMACCSLAV